MIRYKVVNIIDNSSCTVATISKTSRFRKIYNKGDIVEAEPNSLGIFTFDNKKNAISFSKNNPMWKIKRVNSIGRGRIPYSPSISPEVGLEDFYEVINPYTTKDMFTNTHSKSYSLPGTLCYPAVEVLD